MAATSMTAKTSRFVSKDCVEIKFYGAFVLNRCHPTHWLDTTQVRRVPCASRSGIRLSASVGRSRAQRRGVLGHNVPCSIGGIRQLEADLARGRLEADGAVMARRGRDASY